MNDPVLGMLHNLIEDRTEEAKAEIRLQARGGYAQLEILKRDLRFILSMHVDKSGNVMSPAGLARSIQELCR